jgi:hypothetical protein
LPGLGESAALSAQVPGLVVSHIVAWVVVDVALIITDLILVVVVAGLILVVAGLIFVAGIDGASVFASRVPTQLLAGVTYLLAVLDMPLAAVIPAVGMRCVVSVTPRQSRTRQSQERRNCKRQKTDQSGSLHAFPFPIAVGFGGAFRPHP